MSQLAVREQGWGSIIFRATRKYRPSLLFAFIFFEFNQVDRFSSEYKLFKFALKEELFICPYVTNSVRFDRVRI